MSIPRFGMTHPVPVNLLMAAILIGGAVSAITLTREFFPDTTPDSAVVALPYPGASPAEVKEGMARKVEDALADLDEVERLTDEYFYAPWAVLSDAEVERLRTMAERLRERLAAAPAGG